MDRLRSTFSALMVALFIAALPLHARAATLTTEETVYEWTEEEADQADDFDDGAAAERLVPNLDQAPQPSRKAIGHFGPFHMVAPDKAELIGTVGSETPRQFGAMMQAFPGLKQIDLVECPGTDDDEANLALGRMVHRAGITTFVPNGGSVRSGGVELFIAGAKRKAAPGAEFAVHSWRDDEGNEAEDFAADDPVNAQYISFYREMGMSDAQARAFYALTNSVPNDDALYLNSSDIARYITLEQS